jgi:hypothetical protein
MQLTRIQKRVLEQYLLFRRRRPTFLILVRLSLSRSVPVSLYMLVTAAILYWLDVTWAACLMAGMFLGYFSFLVGQLRLILRIWPALEQVLDWDQLELLLQENRLRNEEQ